MNVGEGPDIFMGQSGYSDLLSYNVRENARDLSDQPWAERLDALVAETSSLDGKLYGLTYWDTIGTTWVVNYNMAMFAEHGLTVPTTFDEMKTVCSTLSAAGITPMYEPFSDGWHHVLMFAELGPNYAANTDNLVDGLNANDITLAGNESMATTLNQVNELYQSGCFGDDALSDQYSGMQSAFANDETAMAYANMSFFGTVQNDFPDYDISNIGLFVLPLDDNQTISMNPAGPTKFVYSGSENQDAALAYFDFLAHPDNVAAFLADPAGTKNLPFSDAEGSYPENVLSFLAANPDNRGIVLQTSVNYVNPQWMDIGQDMTAMITGMIDAERVLSNIDDRRTDIAKAAGDPGWD
jgi:raffinose/stachyose/melibiose transport system substrate-binding protein